jgi:glycosyltransferase involved in cell wall biosynthesis
MTNDPRPRLLIVVTSPLSWGPYRGVLRHILSAKLDPIMLSPPGKLLDVVSREENVRTIEVPMEREISPMHDLVSLWKLYRVMRNIRPEIVDASTPKAGFLAGMAAVLARVPCRLYTLRGLRLETTNGLKKAVLWLAEWIACKCAHQVVCVGPSLRDRAIALKLFPRSNGTILGMGSGGVNVTRFHPSNRNSSQAQILRGALGWCGDETVIGFVGRFVRDKGIRELVEAFRTRSKTDPKLRLLLVGDFESGDPVEPEVQRYIESNPSIVRTGFVTDTAPYFALMDMLALPTYREGFPVAPLEAQASGIPVITTTATGAVDSVIDGVTGILVPVGDSEALAGAIEKLLCDPDLRSRMGQAGRARVERDFRSEMHCHALIGEYQKLLKDRACSASVGLSATAHG